MVLQLWCWFRPKADFQLEPRVEEGLKHMLSFPKKPLVSPTLTLPTRECWVLADYDYDTQTISGLSDLLSVSQTISRDVINKNIKNTIALMEKANAAKVRSVYELPEDLFIGQENWDFINATLDLKRYPLLIGPKGCGKTQTAQKLAEARGMEFYPINCGAIFKPKQTLVGQMQAKDGTTFLQNSEFLKHFTSDKPTLIFLDEISRIPPAAANYFMTILDRIQSYIYVEETAERVYKGKNVVFVAAANFGYEYTDTRNLDGALMDRFIKFLVDYLELDEEVKLIQQRVPKANATDIKKLVKQAGTFRETVNAEKFRVAVSTRQLIDMAEYLPLGFSIHAIFDNIFKNLFINGSTDDREDVTKIFDSKM